MADLRRSASMGAKACSSPIKRGGGGDDGTAGMPLVAEWGEEDERHARYSPGSGCWGRERYSKPFSSLWPFVPGGDDPRALSSRFPAAHRAFLVFLGFFLIVGLVCLPSLWSRLSEDVGGSFVPKSLMSTSGRTVKESPSLWENPYSATSSWKPCAERRDDELSGMYLPPENETTGYIFIHAEGGLNQQRIADLLIDLVLKFEDIFDVDHFIDYLKNDVRIVRDIPPWFTDKAELFTSIRRTVKNIPKYASAQFYIDNVLPRVKEKKIMALKPFVDRLGYDNVPSEINRLRCRVNYHALKFLPHIEEMSDQLAARMRNRTGGSNPYMALHLRFEKGMVGLSFCDFVGTREEKAMMAAYRQKEWPRRYKNGSHLWHLALQKRKEGRCPLEPGEVAVILRAMGYPKDTQIYVASGQVYGGQNRMAPLRNMFPNLVTKEELATKVELDSFRKHVTSLAALDFLVCLKSDVFVMTHGGNFAKLIIGARRYMGHRLKSIKPDKGIMSKSFGDPFMGWASFVEDVVITHQTRTGLPEETFPNYDLWENPLTPCMCKA
ncbi:hypothetical protein Taro_020934 [Colocasia esculenta]|uniref:O-fucosyltransferase family protein n=1 Tax=Colocasia esculenta TaxID=4460 RepID=A0A843V9Y5_COLES|nr:hypothetical protein [Colocasia esculenta]